MNYGVISDLHIDLLQESDTDFFNAFSQIVENRRLDVLLLAGDISEDCNTTCTFVKKLKNALGIPVFFVPGNHDCWNKNNKYSTKKIWSIFEEDENCLLHKPQQFSDVAIVGHMGWYDYSFACKDLFSIEQLETKTYQGQTWQDAHFISFEKTDKDICFLFNQTIERQLYEQGQKKIILITHMVNHPFFLVPTYTKNGGKWNYFNGFLGNLRLYELTKHSCVQVAICGHVHYRKHFIENNKSYICPCLGYKKEWPLFDNGGLSLVTNIDNALVNFDMAHTV